jgi:ATP-dependent DNA helicase DinG
MLTALTDMPPGLVQFIAQLYPSATWPLRTYIRQVAGSLPTADKSFALDQARQARALNRPKQEKLDALELLGGRQVLQPVTEEAIQRAFTEQGLLGQMYSNFESRQEQTDMALAVAQALNNHRHLAVEAGTGVGKSMAYLLPLALFARENKVCCGVATKTNTLLDQLLYSELPRLAAALPDGLLFEALKGYDHYPCLRKLRNLCRQTDRPIGKNGITTIASLLSFVCQSSRGDLDRLRLRFDDISRYEVVCNADDCLKRRCRFYQNCLLHGARRAAADADIVLTNQALLFCDVTTSGGILPSIRHWVIDEAHGAEDEARDQLSKAVSARDLAANLDALLGRRGALPALRDACQALAEALPLVARIDTLLAESAVAPVICQSFASELKQLYQLAESSAYDQVDLWINQAVRESGPWAALYSTGASLSHRLAELLGECQMIVGLANEFTELAEAQADLIGLCSELSTHIDALDLILNGDDLSYVYSAEIYRRADQSADRLLAARIDVGEVLATQLYPETLSVIFTSATLAAGSSFDYFARASGLANLPSEAWDSLQLASSYDFDRNMTVFLPTDLPEPNHSGYREALAELLYQVHTALGGSVLTLFTNRREMEDLYQRLKDRLEEAGVQLRCQWRGYANRRLSEEFIANRELSLFALRSFWQGFDAPGDTLRCVIIPKLPFGRPTDPLTCERAQRERDSWKRYVLPEAIIDLRQAAGRLIRSSTDQGALILADSRLLTKWYGQAFIEALPSQQRYTLDTQSITEALRQSGL